MTEEQPPVSTTHIQQFMQRRLTALQKRNLLRTLPLLEHGNEPRIELAGRSLLNLSSNNYLGLATDPALRDAAIEATRRDGCSSGSSRLIAGNSVAYQQLEQRLARFIGQERALPLYQRL